MQRSEFLKSGAAIVGGSMIPSFAFARENKKFGKLRFAFLTDIHVKQGIGAEAGMARALHHAQSLKPKVDFIINGGDSIMDSLEADKQTTKMQWDLFHSLLKKKTVCPSIIASAIMMCGVGLSKPINRWLISSMVTVGGGGAAATGPLLQLYKR